MEEINLKRFIWLYTICLKFSLDYQMVWPSVICYIFPKSFVQGLLSLRFTSQMSTVKANWIRLQLFLVYLIHWTMFLYAMWWVMCYTNWTVHSRNWQIHQSKWQWYTDERCVQSGFALLLWRNWFLNLLMANIVSEILCAKLQTVIALPIKRSCMCHSTNKMGWVVHSLWIYHLVSSVSAYKLSWIQYIDQELNLQND